MRTSRRTRSGGSASIIASAIGPSGARRTSHSMDDRYMRISSRFAAPSSTTRTTGFSSGTPTPKNPAQFLTKNAPLGAANQLPESGGGYAGLHVAGRAAGRQGMFEMAIGAGQVTARLEDLGVVLVELDETLAAARPLCGCDRRRKCRVGLS